MHKSGPASQKTYGDQQSKYIIAEHNEDFRKPNTKQM